MADQDKPRVKMPVSIPRKHLTPGPNSWAQSQQEQQQSSAIEQLCVGQVTNRDKYEHKPMLPPPPVDSSPHKLYLQDRTYIQPAIPLVNPAPKMQSQQKRAVTDPVAPKPLFTARKLSVAKLRKKYSFSKTSDDSSKQEAIPMDQSFPVVQLSSEKVAQVLGIYLPPENKPNTPPASAPLAPAPVSFGVPPYSLERTASPGQQAQSTPAPTRRYLKENDLPTPTITEAPVALNQQVNENPQNQNNDLKEVEEGIPTPGMLHPPRLGRFGNVGEVGLVEANGMHRVESFSGIIENAESSLVQYGEMYGSSTENLSQSCMTQALKTGDSLPPVYSPSNYGGVWENDPSVGYALPPFSPMPNVLPEGNKASRVGPSDNRGIPTMPDKCINGYGNNGYSNPHIGSYRSETLNQNPNTDRSSDYQHPFPSANSWVAGNSFTSTDAPLSALLAPSWPTHQSNNSVPSPPHNQHDYQRPRGMSAAMARLELTLHHHIDSTTGALSRLVTDKHDRIMDQTIRRLENIEETVSKGFRNLKADLRDIRKELDSLEWEFKAFVESSDKFPDFIKGLDGKLEALGKGIKEHSCMCQMATAEKSPDMVLSERQSKVTSHRRTESAHGVLGEDEQRQQYRSGASRSSTSARHSGNSNRAHRSNTARSQPSNGMSDEIGSRREYFAELGAARGPRPDLRDHPAYSGTQQAQGQMFGRDENVMPSVLNGLPFEHPSLSDGRWYQQAYGNKQ